MWLPKIQDQLLQNLQCRDQKMTLLAAFAIPGFEIYDYDYLQTRKMWKPLLTSKPLIYSNLILICVFFVFVGCHFSGP